MGDTSYDLKNVETIDFAKMKADFEKLEALQGKANEVAFDNILEQYFESAEGETEVSDVMLNKLQLEAIKP